MAKVRVAAFSVSLDGYGAGREQSLTAPLGRGGEQLHAWAWPTRTFQAMFGNGGGAIVAFSSVLGLVGGDADFATHAYAASKAGVIGLVRAMAVTYARDGIRCNVVAPGLIATTMSRRAQEDSRNRARLPELQPLTGDFGTPEDVAAACLYLATAPFVTGAVLTVDCGWTAR